MEPAMVEGRVRNDPGAGGAKIAFYTDPLCCWSWAMEPAWRRMQYEYRGNLRVVYKMIGLLPAWGSFHDAVHSVSKPMQMGPEWMHAREVSGMPIEDRIWVSDPPASSFPACIAVKCAGSQSPALGAWYLRALREAVMVRNRNIAEVAVLMDIAVQLARRERSFDLFDFRDAVMGTRGKELFRQDYQEAQYLGIRRTPTLVFRGPGGSSTMIQGYSGYEGLKAALERVLPGVEAVGDLDEAEYRKYWGEGLTEREVWEITNRWPAGRR